MSQLWEKATILVPAGVEMRRLVDDFVRIHSSDLKFSARREVDDRGRPLDEFWQFQWLGKWFIVKQGRVKRVQP